MPYHDRALFEHEAERIRKNLCPTCVGKGEVVVNRETYEMGECHPCKRTGHPTKEDCARLAQHNAGLCLICKMPRVEGSCSGSKYDACGVNDCLDHLRQYTQKLEERIARLEER